MFDHLLSIIIALAEEDKPMNLKGNDLKAFNVMTQEEKAELTKHYREAYQYYRDWEYQESQMTVNNLDCLI